MNTRRGPYLGLRLPKMKASQTTFPRRALGRAARSPLAQAAPAPPPLRRFHRPTSVPELLVLIEWFNSKFGDGHEPDDGRRESSLLATMACAAQQCLRTRR